MTTREELDAALAAAELNLFEWCTGGRSSNNEMMNVESGWASRTETLVHIAAADADNIRAAREQVLGLQLLIESHVGRKTPPVTHCVKQKTPWPPASEATYMLSRWYCTCGWAGGVFRDVKGNPDIVLAEKRARHHEEQSNA